jgi:hypothetical protein
MGSRLVFEAIWRKAITYTVRVFMEENRKKEKTNREQLERYFHITKWIGMLLLAVFLFNMVNPLTTSAEPNQEQEPSQSNQQLETSPSKSQQESTLEPDKATSKPTDKPDQTNKTTQSDLTTSHSLGFKVEKQALPDSESLKKQYGLTEQEIQKWIEMKESISQDCQLDPTCYFKSTISELALSNILTTSAGLRLFVKDTKTLLEVDEKTGKSKLPIGEYYSDFTEICWVFVTIFLIYQSIKFMVTYSIHENPLELKRLIWRLVLCAALIAGFPSLFKWLLTLNSVIVSSLTPKEFINMDAFYGLMKMNEPFLSLTVLALVLSLILLVIYFQNIMRFAELGFLVLSAPLAISTMLNDEVNLFPIWWRQLVSVIFLQAIQTMMLLLTIKTLPLFHSAIQLPVVIGFLYITFKAPGFFRNWLLSSNQKIMINLVQGSLVNSFQTAIDKALKK